MMINDPVLLHDWHPIARAADLTDGTVLHRTLLGEDLVLWCANGTIAAGLDLCIHRGARLSLGNVADGMLVCPFHGWRYNTSGQCVQFPAHPQQVPPQKAHMQTCQVAERYGLVWVCAGQPAHPLPHFPEWEDERYCKVLCGPYPMHVSAPRFMEHFFDIAHFAFVHHGILGDKTHPVIEEYQVETGATGVIARDVRFWQPDLSGQRDGGTVTFNFHIMRPLSGYLEKSSDAAMHFTSFFTVTPVSASESIGWLYIALSGAAEVDVQALQQLQDEIIRQDVPVLESQRPERLPLDLQAELHLRSDRIGIAYRRWLQAEGLTVGTA
jgi:phenylpropionate dioxygenase-like ring-hydroxylating dioxygenase large terminal subunit